MTTKCCCGGKYPNLKHHTPKECFTEFQDCTATTPSGWEADLEAQWKNGISLLRVKAFIRTNFIPREDIRKAIQALRLRPSDGGIDVETGYNAALTDIRTRLGL